MKKQDSKIFQLDARNILQVCGAMAIGALSIYASDMAFFNTLFSSHMSPQTFTVISMILAYLMKKYLTDYSKK